MIRTGTTSEGTERSALLTGLLTVTVNTCVLRYWNPDAEDVGDIAWGQTKETCSPGYVRGDKGPYPEGRKHYYCVMGPRS